MSQEDRTGVRLDFTVLPECRKYTGNMSCLLERDLNLGHRHIRISRKKLLPFSRERTQVLEWKSKLLLPPGVSSTS